MVLVFLDIHLDHSIGLFEEFIMACPSDGHSNASTISHVPFNLDKISSLIFCGTLSAVSQFLIQSTISTRRHNSSYCIDSDCLGYCYEEMPTNTALNPEQGHCSCINSLLLYQTSFIPLQKAVDNWHAYDQLPLLSPLFSSMVHGFISGLPESVTISLPITKSFTSF